MIVLINEWAKIYLFSDDLTCYLKGFLEEKLFFVPYGILTKPVINLAYFLTLNTILTILMIKMEEEF